MTANAERPARAPLDPNVVNMPDGDRERQERYLRKALAEGSMSPSRRRLMQIELRLVREKEQENELKTPSA